MDKLDEARQCMQQGQKSLSKKSLFGSAKPEWDIAAQEFDKAALAFRSAKAFQESCLAYQKASDAHFQTGSVFMAAKAMDNAATVALQNINDVKQASELYQKSSGLFLTHGSADRAGECLEKAARSLESVDAESAGTLYIEACDSYESEDRTRSGVETFRKTRLPRAIQQSERLSQVFLKHENKHAFYKQALSTIIICLAFGDEIDAAKRMDQYATVPGFMSTDEGMTAGDTIQAYESRDADAFEELKKRNCLKYLDNETGKLALSIQLPAGIYSSNQSTTANRNMSQLQDQVEEEGFC